MTSRPRQAVALILSITGSSLIAAGVSFVVNIAAARALGPELRGHVATVLQLAYIIAPLLVFGADRALLRREESARFVLPSFGAIATMCVVAALVIWPIYGVWLTLAVPAALVTGMFTWYRAYSITTRKVKGYLTTFLVFQGSVLVISLGLWTLRCTTWQLWAGVYLFPGILLATYGVYVVRSSDALPVVSWGQAIKRNATLMISGMAKLISARWNRIMLPIFTGADALGLFIVVATATEPLYWLAQSVADYQTTRAEVRNPLRALARGAALFVLLGLAGGVALYLLVVPIFGHAYEPAKALVLPLTISSIMLAMFRQVCGLLLGSSRPERMSTAETAAAIVALVGFPVVIYQWGMFGAAWGSVAVYAVGLMTGVVLLKGTSTDPRKDPH